MKYALLIYSDEKNPEVNPPMDAPEFGAMIGGYMAFTEAVNTAGIIHAGDALQDTDTATSVQVRNGETITTDGPFAETKESLGGFYILDCENLDEAIKWATQIPHALNGTIEIRPVQEFG